MAGVEHVDEPASPGQTQPFDSGIDVALRHLNVEVLRHGLRFQIGDFCRRPRQIRQSIFKRKRLSCPRGPSSRVS
jgi:hypothetical protein